MSILLRFIIRIRPSPRNRFGLKARKITRQMRGKKEPVSYVRRERHRKGPASLRRFLRHSWCFDGTWFSGCFFQRFPFPHTLPFYPSPSIQVLSLLENRASLCTMIQHGASGIIRKIPGSGSHSEWSVAQEHPVGLQKQYVR